MRRGLGVLAILLVHAVPASAQPIEIVPFGGVRFGGDPFEVVATPAAVVDRQPAMGFMIDVPLADGAQFEGLFSHQQATVLLPGSATAAPIRARVSVEHYQIGGLQEYGKTVRPFFTGVLGLTRYATGLESAVRFTAAVAAASSCGRQRASASASTAASSAPSSTPRAPRWRAATARASSTCTSTPPGRWNSPPGCSSASTDRVVCARFFRLGLH